MIEPTLEWLEKVEDFVYFFFSFFFLSPGIILIVIHLYLYITIYLCEFSDARAEREINCTCCQRNVSVLWQCLICFISSVNNNFIYPPPSLLPLNLLQPNNFLYFLYRAARYAFGQFVNIRLGRRTSDPSRRRWLCTYSARLPGRLQWRERGISWMVSRYVHFSIF